MAAIGTIYVYRQNRGASGIHFLQRYFAIGFVVAVRSAAILTSVAIPFYVAMELLGAGGEATTWQEFLFFAAAEIFLYERFGRHIREVALNTHVA